MINSSANGCITIFEEGSFYGVANNDALIFNKYFGYRLYQSKGRLRTGFPKISLNRIMKRLDELSINYKVLHGLDVIVEKTFENNSYAIIDETSVLPLPNASQKKAHTRFHYDRPDYKSFVNALQGICKDIDFYTGEAIEGISQDTKKQIENILAIFEKRVKKYEEKYGIARDTENHKPSANVQNENGKTNTIDDVIEEAPAVENTESDYIKEKQEGTNTSKDFQHTCSNCILRKKGDCFGNKSNICEDYKYAPNMDDEKRENWPKYGDATFIRMHGRGRN